MLWLPLRTHPNPCTHSPPPCTFFSFPLRPAGPGAGFGAIGATASQLAAALERVAALEKHNAELRDDAARKDAVLAESRKFIQGYLQRTQAAADERQAAMRDPEGAVASTNGVVAN